MDFANSKNKEMIIYPRELILKDKTKIIIRPLEEDHKEGIYWRSSTEIKLIVDPEHRGKGLGLQMFKILLAEGLNHNFEKVVVRFTNDNKSFVRILDHFGFKPEAVLTCYIKDEQAEIRKDLVIASYNLKDWARRFEFYSLIYSEK